MKGKLLLTLNGASKGIFGIALAMILVRIYVAYNLGYAIKHLAAHHGKISAADRMLLNTTFYFQVAMTDQCA